MTWTLVFQIIALLIAATFLLMVIAAAIITARKGDRAASRRLNRAEQLALHDAEAHMRSISRPNDGDLLAKIKERYS